MMDIINGKEMANYEEIYLDIMRSRQMLIEGCIGEMRWIYSCKESDRPRKIFIMEMTKLVGCHENYCNLLRCDQRR